MLKFHCYNFTQHSPPLPSLSLSLLHGLVQLNNIFKNDPTANCQINDKIVSLYNSDPNNIHASQFSPKASTLFPEIVL